MERDASQTSFGARTALNNATRIVATGPVNVHQIDEAKAIR
jgi:hypothetical protein